MFGVVDKVLSFLMNASHNLSYVEYISSVTTGGSQELQNGSEISVPVS